MPLPSSGSISLNQMHIEVGGTSGTQVSLNDSDIRALISKASGAQMSFSEWYGASSAWTSTMTVGARTIVKSLQAGFNSGLGMGSLSDDTIDILTGAPEITTIVWTDTGNVIFEIRGTFSATAFTSFSTQETGGTLYTFTTASRSNFVTGTFSDGSGTYSRWNWTGNTTNVFGLSGTRTITVNP